MIHKPKEGVFKAEIGDKDFEFWMLRTEITKIVFWLMRNWPLPWVDILAFKWFGIKMSVTSSLYDAWCDGEFIQFGRKNLVGQGANIMSSMVVGKYLVIKKVIFGDYVLVGAMTTIAPGTIIGKETLTGAASNTVYNQVLEPGWVYLGIPMTKYKPNKYAESRRDIISKKDVDDKKRFDIEHQANIEENNSK
jgi:carbonic anhydrase/acetyltransferase-like protein (isoleucine patch superfamily)